jgi:GT2 family glycosyltransferase
VGPVANAAPISQRVGPRDARAAEAALIAAKRRRRHVGRWTEEPWLGGFCLLVNAAAVVEAGGFSETLPLEDALLELFGRLKAAGFVVACARGAWVHHAELTLEEGRSYGLAVVPAAEAAASATPT